MSVGEKLTQIAEKMPVIYSVGYSFGQTDGYNRGYEKGKQEGGIAGREPCLMNHYTATFFGSGTNELLLDIPFQPDIVTVYTTHSYTSCFPNCYRGFTVDLRACGRHMGNFYYTLGEGITRSAWLTSTLEGTIVSFQDGKFRFGLDAEAVKDVAWIPNIQYRLIAMKFPEENGKQLLQEEIMNLPDTVPQDFSGQLAYVKSVVYTYFTPEEWESLTAQKPNWTFVLK